MNIIFKILSYLSKNSNLIKSVVIIALTIICIAQMSTTDDYKSLYEEEMKSGSIVQSELEALRAENEDLKLQISEYEILVPKKNTQIQQLQKEVKNLEETTSKLSAKLKDIPQKETFEVDNNYKQAQQVWNYLKDLGLNQYVCAGILGNIMAEVGGHTLDISGWVQYSHNGYYGICQWAGSRKTRLLNNFGTTLESQIKFLGVELFEVIPRNNSFYSMQNEQEAALYFAKYYERCSSKYYSVRQSNATKALAYFT